MKNLFIILFTLFSSVSFVTSGYADNFNASVVVTRPIVLTETTRLNFGSIVITDVTKSHSIVMASGGTVAEGGGFKVIGTTTAGEIAISGEANTVTNVNVTPTTTLSAPVGVTADPLNLEVKLDGNSSVTLDGSGQASIKIIGTVEIPGDAAAATYSGTYTVQVTY